MSDSTPMPQEAPLTIAGAHELLVRGEVSSEELVRSCLQRIEQVDPILKACVTVMAEQALAQARAADEARKTRMPRSPLYGIPLGIKDLMMTRGIRTTAGSHVLDDWIPDEDAAVVAKLTEAGAIALCKTNSHEFAFGTVTPPTLNPWDTERGPGGSSGGSAAAVASGEVIAALGTDTGGSIRIPSSWCGVTGLKPTYGLVSCAGIIPLSWSYDHAGPIAHTVEDCALLVDALVGYDPHDPNSIDVPAPDYAAALVAQRTPADAVRGTRIGVPNYFFFDFVDPEVEASVRAAIAQFESLGATIEEVAVPHELNGLFDAVYRGVQRPEAYTYHADKGWLTERAGLYTPTVRTNLEAGAKYSAADYIRAQQARRGFADAMRKVLERVDVLIVPTVAVVAPPIEGYDAWFKLGGREIPAGSLRLTFPFNLTGQPALTLPCGFTTSGLPIGMQVAARHFGEPTLLRLGHAYQRVTDWHNRPTPLA
ncbi:MAG TPA: amidase [Ktedonobacterales bacterium]|nr:amidase [Ktedonobacterales bacterium]